MTIAPSANNKEKNQESMKYLNFTRWLILALLTVAGNISLSGQIILPPTETTCICTDGDRIKDEITFNVMTAGTSVHILDYPLMLPSSVLWRDPIADNTFYLDGDDEDKHLDTLTSVAGESLTFEIWRNGNINFNPVRFTDGISIYSVNLPVCSATVDDAITAVPGDTVCLGSSMTFNLPGGLMIDSVRWSAYVSGDAATGTLDSTTIDMSGSFSHTFMEPGDHTITAVGVTPSSCPINSELAVHVIGTDYVIEGFDFACAGDAVPFNMSAGFSTAIFDTVTWTITSMSGNGTYTYLGGDSTDVGAINVQFDSTDTYTVMVSAMKTTGSAATQCMITDMFTINVQQEIGAGIVGDTVVCVNNLRGFKANVNMLQTITWTSATGSIIGSSTNDSVTVNFSNAGFDTIRVSGVTGGGCIVSDSIIVDVKDSQIQLAGDTTVCVGDVQGYRAMYTDASVANFSTIAWSVIPMTAGNDTTTFTASTPGDSLEVTWGAIGTYMIQVSGTTDLGCNLFDEFVVTVQDTNHFIEGPTLVCVGDLVQFELLQATDSSAVSGTSIDWEVYRYITSTNEVDEAIIDFDGNSVLNHSFSSGTISKSGYYIVVADGLTENGCAVTDTFQLEVIGNTDLSVASINSTGTYCAGGIFEFELVLDDTLQTGPLNWTAFQKSNNAPVIGSAIDQSRGDTVTIDFPNVADTFVVQVTGTAGPSCTFTVQHEIVVTDDLFLIDADRLDTLCLTQDSTWYAVNIDTGDVDLGSVTWSITNNAGGGAIFPAMTGSGSNNYLSIAYRYPGPGIYTHRVRGMETGTGCEFDETLMVTVKDTTYFLVGDTQICLGDTTEYALLDANMMPLGDFPMGDTLNWLVGGLQVPGNGAVMTGSVSALGFSFSEYSGPINDTLRIVWAVGGEQLLSISDSTLCCPIEVSETILVRDNDFELLGPIEVCQDSVSGYKITNFNGTDIDDLVPDSTRWSVHRGTVIGATVDSLTIDWDLTNDFVTISDTIIFSGYTNDGCAVHDTLAVTIRSGRFVIEGADNVCQGDPINLVLKNAADSSIVDDIDSLSWVFNAGADTITLDSTILDVFVDSNGDTQNNWSEQGTHTVRAIGFTRGTCRVAAEFIVVVNENPDPEIQGDTYTCVNGTDEYSIEIDMTNVDSVEWQVRPFAGTPDAGTIVSGQGTTDIVVSWGATGQYLIIVEGATNGGCVFMDTLQPIEVVGAASIGQLACNNDINVTLPDNCELMLTPGQILQDQDPLIPDDEYEIHVEDAVSGVRLSNGLVDASLLGIELKVVITHECSGQTCWGYITLEDKTIPELLCSNDTIPCTSSIDPSVLGYPVDVGSTVTQTSSNPPLYDVTGFEKCGVAQLTYNDRTSSEVCTGDYGTVIYRDWKLTNSAGLMSTCTDTILVGRVSIDSLDLSELRDFIGDDGFECHLVTREQLNPGTLTGDLSVATSELCFNVQLTHSDVDSEFCGESSYRITRTWTILDWCTGEVRTHQQRIDVLDKEGPVITLATGNINISATDHDCTGEYDLTPDVTVIDRCSNPVSTTLRIFENDETGSLLYTITDGDYSGLRFDPDVTQIFIDVQSTDACGKSNQRSVTRMITITDDVRPIPICDESTTISIGDQGWAIANWHAFDDGSLDNCGIEKIEVRRMENNCDDFPENLVYGEYVKFCCEDAMAGVPVIVELRVTDVNGNVNVCNVAVTIQDNSVISKVVREGDKAISCTDDVTPYLTDDGSTVVFLTETCGIPKAPTRFTAAVDTTDCGSGTIVRNWLIQDELGNILTHSQTITRGLPGETFDPADLVNIWPPDYVGEGCAGPNTDPDVLPEAFRPNIDLEAYTCSSLGLDHEDLIFRDVEGLCAKVLRTWTLYDWCQRDPNDPNSGKWEYVQILQLTDTVDPVIDSGCEMQTFAANSTNSCSATVNTSATADDCHDTDDLAWTFSIIDENGTTVLEGNRNTISTILEVGDYTVTWTATDPCGNSGTCDKVLRVLDAAEPNAIFRDITKEMTTAGVTIDASEVVIRVTDNCTDEEDISFHFNTVDGPSSLTFDCVSMLGMATRSVHPDIYAVDAAGNSWKGHVNITLDDTADVCGNDGGTTGEGSITGQIFTEQDFTVDDVEVTLTTMNTGASTFEMTPIEGEYAFTNVPMNSTYEVSASRDDNYLNGVSTLDLLLIQRHILGLSELDSPYKVIAADVDGSDHVSAIDLVHLRRLILGLSTEFPIGKPWTFVDAHQVFDDEVRPFPYNEKHVIDQMATDHVDMDFVGVKLGDVNGNVQLQSVLLGITRSIESIDVATISQQDNQVTIGLTPNVAASVAGLQLAIGLNAGVDVINVHSNQVEITAENYTVINGELRISWNSIEAIDVTDESLIYVTLQSSNESAAIADMISLSGNHITSEIYTEDLGEITVNDVVFEFAEGIAEGFIVEQNVPNPFNGLSQIRFYQPSEGNIELTITDMSGRQVQNITNYYNKGWHTLDVSTEDLPGSGIYIYQMSNGSEVIRKKMITID